MCKYLNVSLQYYRMIAMPSLTSFKKWYWPRLIRRAEKSTRLKFERKPILTVQQRRGGLKGPAANEFRERGSHPHVYLTKRLIREDPKLAETCAGHELRELLYKQKGYSSRQAHLRSKKRDGKRTSWRLRVHCGFRKGDGIIERG